MSSPPSPWPPVFLLRRSRWAALAAGAWIQCTSGSSYCFGVYSPILKSSQSYDQSTLDSVAFFKDVGANVGVISGLLYSSPPPFGGPRAVLFAGAVQCFLGYLLMWLSVTGVLPRPPPALMCFYMLIAAHAQTFFNTANVVTAVQNFPNTRGTVIGIMKGFLGLSGAILIQLYRTVFNGNPSSFLLMLALLPTLLTLLLMYFVQVQENTNERDDKRRLDAFSVIALTIAAYLMIVIIAEEVLSLGLAARIVTLVLLLMLLVSPLVTVTKAQLAESKVQLEGASSCQEKTPLINILTSSNQDQHPLVPPSRENLNILQAMRSCDFWLLFLAMSCGMGSGLATVNNISQVGSSLGFTSKATSSLVSLWSIWNFLGRFGIGYISDYFLFLRGWARPMFIAITLAVMSVGHAIIASGLPGTLHVGSILVGVCYGSQWALMPSITSELFGLRHFGTIFNTIAIASPIGSYILSVRVVGYIYDTQSSSAAGVATCTGRHCFMLSFLIMASVALFGFSVAFILFLRTRRFYKQVIFAHLKASTSL